VAFTIHDDDLAPSTAESGTLGTTLAFSPTSVVPVGKLAVLLATTSPETPLGADLEDGTSTSVTDAKSNTWVRAAEGYRNAQTQVGAVLYSVITTQIETTDTITLTMSANSRAHGVALATFNISGGSTIEVAGKDYTIQVNTSYTTTVSGLTSEEHLWIGTHTAALTAAQLGAKDSAYTAITQGGAATWGATGTESAFAGGGYVISTGTSETYDNAGPLTNGGRVTILVAFKEVAAGGGAGAGDPFGMSGFFGS